VLKDQGERGSKVLWPGRGSTHRKKIDDTTSPDNYRVEKKNGKRRIRRNRQRIPERKESTMDTSVEEKQRKGRSGKKKDGRFVVWVPRGGS